MLSLSLVSKANSKAIYTGIKKFIPYISVALLCILLNFIYFNHLLNQEKRQEILVLQTYIDNIGSNIANSFKAALKGEKTYASSLIFQTYVNTRGLDSENYIGFAHDSLSIITPTKIFKVNNASLKQYIENIIPEYVSYIICIDNFTLAKSRDIQKGNVISVSREYQFIKNQKIIVKIAIESNHPAYLANINNIYYTILGTLLASLSITLALIRLHLKQKHQLKSQINQLEESLKETTHRLKSKAENEEQTKNSLILQLQSERTLRRLFIKNATAIYLDNNIPNMSPEQKRVNELSNFLFPIAFTEPANDEEIKVHEVIKDLTDYTAFEATKYDISFDKQVETLKVQCSKTVFYQILFSLVSNLIHLMPAVSGTPLPGETKKKFTVTFLAEKIIIDYETFPLSADNIGGFLRKKGTDVVDAFFLDYRRILESLKTHKIDYTMNTNPTGNRFELDFKKKIPKGKPNLRLVE